MGDESLNKVLSIVIPAHEHQATLERCLSALASAATDDMECIIVDDASADDAASTATRFHVGYLRLEKRMGGAISRNTGAALAVSPWLLFLDADCLITKRSLEEIKRIIRSRPEEVAFFGSYDDAPLHPAPVSQFRNLLHYHFHQTAPSGINTFWTACGAIRKDVFFKMGGFEPVDSSIRDIDLGYRLTRAGYRIRIYPHIQIKHMKRWTLRNMIVTDIAKRGIPWTRLLLKYGLKEGNLNLRVSQRIAGLGLGCALLGLILSFWKNAFLAPALVGFLIFLSLNAPIFRMFASKKGVKFLAWAIPLQAVYYLSALTGLFLGVMGHCVHRWREH
jgi:GT2 family glycosyltransferase